MKKKKNKWYHMIIGSVLVGILFFLVASMVLTKDQYPAFLPGWIKDVGLWINDLTTKPIQYLTGTKASDILIQSDAMLETQITELKKELNELKEVLELNQTMSERTYLNATVTNRNIGYWYRNLTIDKGAQNGVVEGMAVVSKDGLIGTITKAENYHSTVRLLTSTASPKISVKIEVNDDFIYGLLVSFDEEDKVFLIEGISDNREIPAGSVVSTTGMGSSYPSGIYIGTVASVETDHFDLAKMVYVTPGANFEDISVVTIFDRKTDS